LRLLPDFITLIRLLASPVVIWLLTESRFRAALGVVLVAGITDWLDGFTARKLGTSGKLGVVFDPLADKALLVTLFLVLGWIHLVPLWMVILVMGRDLVIVTGALLLRVLRGVRRFLPTVLGKVSTFFQITLVLLVLLNAAFPAFWLRWLETAALTLSALFTTLSFIDYVRIGIELTKRTRSRNPSIDGTTTGE
jgi:cardiolipin synthase